MFTVDTWFWTQSKWVLCIRQWVGTVVAACGREWRFLNLSNGVLRGASLCFGRTETACSLLTEYGRSKIPLVYPYKKSIYLIWHSSRYSVGEVPVCCLKYRPKDACSGKLRTSAISLMLIFGLSNNRLDSEMVNRVIHCKGVFPDLSWIWVAKWRGVIYCSSA